MAEQANVGLRPGKVQEIAGWATAQDFARISPEDAGYLKVLVLDSLGCSIAALSGGPVGPVRDLELELGGSPLCTLIGSGKSAPDRAAFFNGALLRYLDFMDIFMVEGQTFHPSDNFAVALAGSELAGAGGETLLTALAVAYQVQARFSEAAPLQEQGFDHVAHLAYSMPAALSVALGLDAQQAANALALCGSFINTLWIVRTGRLSRWKGFASAQAAMAAMHMTLLASRGMTGPLDVLEGERAWESSVGKPVDVDWPAEPLDQFKRSSVKRYNAEAHTQSAIDAALQLREQLRREGVRPEDVLRVELDTFNQALEIVGGGAGGDRVAVHSKEQADHSLPYLLAVALIDGDVQPEQFTEERVKRGDVQDLLRRVWVRQREELTQRYPQEMPASVTVLLRDGRELKKEVSDYPGFWRTRPLDWDAARAKFERLTRTMADPRLRDEIAGAVQSLERMPVRDLTSLLERVRV